MNRSLDVPLLFGRSRRSLCFVSAVRREGAKVQLLFLTPLRKIGFGEIFKWFCLWGCVDNFCAEKTEWQWERRFPLGPPLQRTSWTVFVLVRFLRGTGRALKEFHKWLTFGYLFANNMNRIGVGGMFCLILSHIKLHFTYCFGIQSYMTLGMSIYWLKWTFEALLLVTTRS